MMIYNRRHFLKLVFAGIAAYLVQPFFKLGFRPKQVQGLKEAEFYKKHTLAG